MGIQLDKNSLNVSGSVSTDNINSSSSSVDTQKNSWEFFKNIFGFFTRLMNSQINIPSTAITPNLSIPTKAIFLNILKSIELLKTLKNRINEISDIMQKDNSNRNKQKELIKINIIESYNEYKRRGEI